LLAGGRAADTPAAVISAGTRPDQRTVTAPLADLPAVVAATQLVAPALVVIGDVVRCRELLAPSALAGVAITATDPSDSLVEPEATWAWAEATR
jgi:siroheme synthase